MRHRQVRATVLLTAMMALAFTAQAAPPEGKGNSGHGHAGQSHANHGNSQHTGHSGLSSDLIWAGITVSLARRYALEDGLGGYAALPPGIRKNLARGKPLPPGIAKKAVPAALLGQLPYHPGYEWRIAGSDLILISIATAVVADVLHGVFD